MRWRTRCRRFRRGTWGGALMRFGECARLEERRRRRVWQGGLGEEEALSADRRGLRMKIGPVVMGGARAFLKRGGGGRRWWAMRRTFPCSASGRQDGPLSAR